MKWTCRRNDNFGIEGAIKGTKEEVLEWMKRHFAGLRPCGGDAAAAPAWFVQYQGGAMRFKTADAGEVYLVEDIAADCREKALQVLAEMNAFLGAHAIRETFTDDGNEHIFSRLNDKIRALGWVALFDNGKMYKKEDGLHMQAKLVDPDSEATWHLP